MRATLLASVCLCVPVLAFAQPSTGPSSVINLPQTAPPSTPTASVNLYSDGVGLHAQTPSHDIALFGSYKGDLSSAWTTSPLAFGNNVTDGSVPNVIRIQRDDNYTGNLYANPAALLVTDNVGANVGSHANAITATSHCNSTVSNAPVCGTVVFSGVYAATTPGKGGNPLVANVFAQDNTGRGTATSGSLVAQEDDIFAAGPDTNGIRAIFDNTIGENLGPSSDGATTVSYGERFRPANYNPTYFTGPSTLIYGVKTQEVTGWPGSAVQTSFFSDGNTGPSFLLTPGSASGTINAAVSSGSTTIPVTAASAFSTRVGDYVTDAQAAIPPATQVTAVSAVSGGVFTITLSNATTAAITSGDVASFTTTFSTAMSFTGHYTGGFVNWIVDDALLTMKIGSTASTTGNFVNVSYNHNNSGGLQKGFASMIIGAGNVNSGAENGNIVYQTVRAGTLTNELTLNGGEALGALPAKGVGTLNATGLYINSASIAPLVGTTASIGGSALAAGACTSGTVTVTGATTAMAVSASPVTYPGAPYYWQAYVSAANTASVNVCAAVAGTPTASAYNVRVIP